MRSLNISKPTAALITAAYAVLAAYLIFNICAASLNKASDATGYISLAALFISALAMFPVVSRFDKP